jgi:hypothetical protein
MTTKEVIMRIMRKLSNRLGFVLALVIATVTFAGTASAVAAPASNPTATEWRYIGSYLLPQWCQSAGKDGITQGQWQQYTCTPHQVGLDLYFDLYVSP